jgi:hypothetical protein
MESERDFNDDYEISALNVGYICFFGAGSPIVALVGQAIFALKLFFDVYAISVYQKRYVSAPVKNIGSWNQIF